MKDHVAEEIKTERIGRLIALVRGVAKQKNVGLIGTTHEVLVEGQAKRGALLQARTRTNKIALLDGPAEWLGTYRRGGGARPEGVSLLRAAARKQTGGGG